MKRLYVSIMGAIFVLTLGLAVSLNEVKAQEGRPENAFPQETSTPDPIPEATPVATSTSPPYCNKGSCTATVEIGLTGPFNINDDKNNCVLTRVPSGCRFCSAIRGCRYDSSDPDCIQKIKKAKVGDVITCPGVCACLGTTSCETGNGFCN